MRRDQLEHIIRAAADVAQSNTLTALERAREHAPATMAVLEATGGWDGVADRAEAEENARRESIARVEKKLRRERQGK